MRDRVATDIGGTFTDFVALEEGTGRLTLTKVSSTPDAPERAVRECVEKVEHDLSNTQYLIHGTTIAINTLLELKGAKTALLTTKGFRDVYEIGRANRLDMYDCLLQQAQGAGSSGAPVRGDRAGPILGGHLGTARSG